MIDPFFSVGLWRSLLLLLLLLAGKVIWWATSPALGRALAISPVIIVTPVWRGWTVVVESSAVVAAGSG